MDLAWNLNDIYNSFTCSEFLEDKDKLEKSIDTINKIGIEEWDKEKDVAKNIKKFLELKNEYESIYSKLDSYAYLRTVSNVNDIEAIQMLDYIDNKNSEHTKAIIEFSRWINSIENLEDIIINDKYILNHKFYLENIKLKSKYLLSEREEVIISKMQNTGSKSWQAYYMELVSEVTEKIKINGIEKELTLGELCKLAYDSRAKVRKEAFYKQIKLCERLAKGCEKCINGMSGEVNLIYEMRGYNSVLDKTLIDSGINIEVLNSMTEAIEESLPVFHEYYKKKAKVLKCKSSLQFFDLYANMGEMNKVISYSECKDIIVSAFNEFSEELGSFANMVFEKRWIDAEARKGKSDFGLEVDIFPIKESKICVNFDGNINDVSIIAHEIGHAYHGFNLFGETMLNTSCGVAIAEIASTFCELLLNNKLIKTKSRQKKLVALEKSISDSLYFIMEFYVRYLFENELYERRKEGELSVNELNCMIIKYVKKVYGDSIDQSSINPYMWLNKAGYFMQGNEFLNYPYSFGVLFAKGLYAEYLKKGNAFVEEFKIFLKNSGKNSIVDNAKLVGININDISFWRSSIKVIESEIDELIKLLE